MTDVPVTERERRLRLPLAAWAAVAVALVAGLPITFVGEFMLWALAPHAVEGAWVVILPGFMLAIGGLGMCASALGLAWSLRHDPGAAPRWITRAAVCGTIGYTPVAFTWVAWMLLEQRRGGAVSLPLIEYPLTMGAILALAIPALVLLRLLTGPRLAGAASGAVLCRWGRAWRVATAATGLGAVFVQGLMAGPSDDRGGVSEPEDPPDRVLEAARRTIATDCRGGFRFLRRYEREVYALGYALEGVVPACEVLRFAEPLGATAARQVAKRVADPLDRRVFLVEVAADRTVLFEARDAALWYLGEDLWDRRASASPSSPLPDDLAESLAQIALDPDADNLGHYPSPGGWSGTRAPAPAESLATQLSIDAIWVLSALSPSEAHSALPTLRRLAEAGNEQAGWARVHVQRIDEGLAARDADAPNR